MARNEKRRLQKAVDSFIYNGQRGEKQSQELTISHFWPLSQVGHALRAIARMDEGGPDAPLAPLGPHANWMVRASTEVQALIELLEEGSLQEGVDATFVFPAPASDPLQPPGERDSSATSAAMDALV
eukprot:2352165-Pyramimonas_sp.AAC.2